ncbi:MAG TPA: AI-2E family transporter [Chloroflexota bacterium]|nr:AI-2E family transporter [Chloroflexota bacterium]
MSITDQVEVRPRPEREPEPEPAVPVVRGAPLRPAAKWAIAIAVILLGIVFLIHIKSEIYPFLWGILAAYILTPVVNYVNFRLLVPRVVVVVSLYFLVFCLLIVGSRYFFPWISNQISYFIEDFPKLQGALIHTVGPRPLGIDINQLMTQLAGNLNGLTGNPRSAVKLLADAFNTAIRILIFLFTTFYLLMDGPRIKRGLTRLIPLRYRPEMLRLAGQINTSWTQYIRGELVLFGIMTVASFVGLELLRVPGAVPLALATGALELLPIVGPITAGALAVSVAYLNGTNPFGWNQITYGLVVAGMYLLFRELEDYVVVPRVLGRAVKLHPVIVLFSLVSGGLILGLFGLLIAVPVAASLKIVGAYLYDKLVDEPSQFVNIHAVQD